MEKQTFYLIMLLVNIVMGAFSIKQKAYWWTYLCTWSGICSIIWYAEIAWNLTN